MITKIYGALNFFLMADERDLELFFASTSNEDAEINEEEKS